MRTLKFTWVVIAILLNLTVLSQIPTDVQNKINNGDWILEVPTSYITGTSAVRDSFINWTIRSEIISISTGDDNSYFQITSNWNPSNSNLNSMEVIGADTYNWPLFLVVNDSTFFIETIPMPDTIDNNNILIYGRYTQPYRKWGDYFTDTHEMYYYSAPNPDQYNILGSNNAGEILKLSQIRDIVSKYSQCTGYRTNYSIEILKPSMEARSAW